MTYVFNFYHARRMSGLLHGADIELQFSKMQSGLKNHNGAFFQNGGSAFFYQLVSLLIDGYVMKHIQFKGDDRE